MYETVKIYNSGEDGIAETLDASYYRGQGSRQGKEREYIVMAYNQISQSAVYKEANVSVSLTCCGGSYGGGSEVLVIQGDYSK